MKVDVQKPIQSLHAFMRHHFGEGLSGSSPIFRSTVIIMTVLFLGTGIPSAQDRSDSNVQVNDEKRLDLLFDRIMQTLPEGERTRVDSAATIKVDRNSVTEKSSVQTSGHEPVITPRERLKELPDELKVQVERAITDMEQRKEDRKTQFRESLRNR
ncbi:MAG: hypothetical protein JW863_02595 [Chitinispirillaceae bacterium]|nr:hypothetical protein [Chitinispirillaceae bacterium]